MAKKIEMVERVGVCSLERAQHIGMAARVAGGYVATESHACDALQRLLGNVHADDCRARYLVEPADFGDLGSVTRDEALAAVRSAPNAHQPECQRLIELLTEVA